jgi:hypothetical protein
MRDEANGALPASGRAARRCDAPASGVGDPEEPSPEVEEFAAGFYICAEEQGLDHALTVVASALCIPR